MNRMTRDVDSLSNVDSPGKTALGHARRFERASATSAFSRIATKMLWRGNVEKGHFQTHATRQML